MTKEETQNKREYIVRNKVVRIVTNHDSMTFSAILRCLRGAYGITRKEVMQDIGIHHMHLYYLENGIKSRGILDDEVKKLAIYYDFPFVLLLEKAEKQRPHLRRFERKGQEGHLLDQG